MLFSGYRFVSRSNSTIIRLMNVENFLGGPLSFPRWGSCMKNQNGYGATNGKQGRTSNSLPSILSCQAGILSPVSGLARFSPSVPVCQDCPDTVWLTKSRKVRAVLHTFDVYQCWFISSGCMTHCRIARKGILNFHLLPRHCPIKLSLHIQQALVHLRVFCKVWILKNDIGKRLVGELSSSEMRVRADEEAMVQKGSLLGCFLSVHN